MLFAKRVLIRKLHITMEMVQISLSREERDLRIFGKRCLASMPSLMRTKLINLSIGLTICRDRPSRQYSWIVALAAFVPTKPVRKSLVAESRGRRSRRSTMRSLLVLSFRPFSRCPHSCCAIGPRNENQEMPFGWVSEGTNLVTVGTESLDTVHHQIFPFWANIHEILGTMLVRMKLKPQGFFRRVSFRWVEV